MSQTSSTSSEQISEEANGDVFSFLNQSDPFADLGFEFLFDESPLSPIVVNGVCDFSDLTDSLTYCTEPNELDGYLGPASSANKAVECDNNRALMTNPLVKNEGHKKKVQPLISPIPLSQSVGVGLPQKTHKSAQKVRIVYELEEFFRPRYKSDYFAQNGKSRKPRYVADRFGNHFITLQIPVGLHGQIRVDWLTIADKSGDRYSMPYRFQQSNELAGVPDCNPLYVDIKADINGLMKLYLVLIKSKQDELKTLQPLKPFRPFHDMLGMPEKPKIESSYVLNPKQLIQTYQLERSQLAFTFCSFGAKGQSPIPEWDTTVFSTVLTETTPENAKQRPVACPRCTHVFHIAATNEQDAVQETVVVNKRKAERQTTGRSIKKQNSFQDGLEYFN